MKRALWFALAVGATIGLTAWAASAAFYSRIGDEGVHAIVMSAGVAFVVQCLTFGVALALFPASAALGWGAGIVMRLFVVAIHWFVGVRVLGVPAEPALLSLVLFFFITTLIEPFFLPPPATPAPQANPPASPS